MAELGQSVSPAKSLSPEDIQRLLQVLLAPKPVWPLLQFERQQAAIHDPNVKQKIQAAAGQLRRNPDEWPYRQVYDLSVEPPAPVARTGNK